MNVPVSDLALLTFGRPPVVLDDVQGLTALFFFRRRKPRPTPTATNAVTIPVSTAYPTMAGRPRNVGEGTAVNDMETPVALPLTVRVPDAGDAEYPGTVPIENV